MFFWGGGTSAIVAAEGWRTDYPVALWEERKFLKVEDIGVNPPLTYSAFKHANCIGCLKGGILHWYVTYSTRKDIFQKAKETEEIVGHSILKVTIDGETTPLYLEELEYYFAKMELDGIAATEHQSAKKFVHMLKQKYGLRDESKGKPCECTF